MIYNRFFNERQAPAFLHLPAAPQDLGHQDLMIPIFPVARGIINSYHIEFSTISAPDIHFVDG